MEYKYMKVFRKAGKTLGITTDSNNDADQSTEIFLKKYEIFQLGETIGQSTDLEPAKLVDGYYPFEHFAKCPPTAADYIREGEGTKFNNFLECYIYIGPAEERAV